jgi:hypothetical protein
VRPGDAGYLAVVLDLSLTFGVAPDLIIEWAEGALADWAPLT